MEGNEIRISSIAGYITEVNKLLKESKYNPKIHTAFFRGHADKQWELKPSLMRNEGFIENEHLMYRTIAAKHTTEFSTCSSALDYLVKMQHYGLPTRLLDLTTNPLVALYFACEEHQAYDRVRGKDGEVIVLKTPTASIKHYDSDTISILANLSKCKEEEMNICLYSDKWSDGNIYEMLNLKKESRRKFVHHIGEFYKNTCLIILENGGNQERLKVLLNSLLDFTKSNSLVEPSFFDGGGNLKDTQEVMDEINNIRLQPYERGMLTKLRSSPIKEPINSFMDYIKWFNNLEEIKLLLHQISLEKSHFSPAINPHDLAQVYIVNVKHDNQRIRNQMGSFILFGLGFSNDNDSLMLSKKEVAQIPDGWNLSSSTRLVIDPNNKKKIIEELGLLGISKSFIYPELEVFAKELGKQYRK